MIRVLSLLAVAVSFWRSANSSPFLPDASYLFGAAHRIMLGEVPYRDFVLYATPGTHYTLALLMSVFGKTYLVARVYAAVQAGLVVGLTGIFCRQLFLDRATTALVCCLQIIWAPTIMGPMMWYDGDATFLALLTGVIMLHAWERTTAPWWTILGGATAALAFWFKQDIGAGVMIGAALGTWLVFLEDFEEMKLLGLSIGFFVVFLAAMVAFSFAGAVPDLWHYAVLNAISYKFGALQLALPGGWVDRSAVLVMILYAFAAFCGFSRDTRTGAALMIFFLALFCGLATHHFQAYSTKMATLGCVFAVLLVSDDSRREPSWWAAALSMSILGLNYWGNCPLERVPLKDPHLVGLYASDDTTDKTIAFLRSHPDRDFVTMNSLVYFSLGMKPPHRFLHPAEEAAGVAALPLTIAQ